MFNAKQAFICLNGHTYSYKELCLALRKIRIQNFRTLPPEFGTHELFMIAQKKNWFTQEANGKIKVAIRG
jgi:hypothetical protein